VVERCLTGFSEVDQDPTLPSPQGGADREHSLDEATVSGPIPLYPEERDCSAHTADKIRASSPVVPIVQRLSAVSGAFLFRENLQEVDKSKLNPPKAEGKRRSFSLPIDFV